MPTHRPPHFIWWQLHSPFIWWQLHCFVFLNPRPEFQSNLIVSIAKQCLKTSFHYFSAIIPVQDIMTSCLHYCNNFLKALSTSILIRIQSAYNTIPCTIWLLQKQYRMPLKYNDDSIIKIILETVTRWILKINGNIGRWCRRIFHKFNNKTNDQIGKGIYLKINITDSNQQGIQTTKK